VVEPQRSTVRFDEASLGRFEPNTNPTRGKAREKSNRHPNGEVLLDNADAVIDALRAGPRVDDGDGEIFKMRGIAGGERSLKGKHDPCDHRVS